jgi:hypothetical protein
MPKQLKKIKVKKPKKPRQPRRAGVPRKPPVTNISVNISGGSGQPTGSYYFPDAQQVQPLVNNIFTPSPNVPAAPRPRVLEEPALQPFDIIPAPMREVVEVATQTAPRPIRLVTNTGSQTQASVPSSAMPLLPPTSSSPAAAGGGARRGRPISEFSTSNKSIAQLREMATSLGIGITNKSGKVLKSEIDYLKRKGI